VWRGDPDVILMEQVRDGDVEAFEALFRKYSSSVVKLAYHFVRSRERAEELAQTAFLQLYRARHRYEPRARFLTYLYRITTNICLNELRRREYSATIKSLDTPIDDGSGSTPVSSRIPDEMSEDPAQQLAAAEITGEVQRVLDQLPLNQRTAFLLGRVDGMSYRDVADTLNTSVSAVKSLIFRATSALRWELRGVIQDSEAHARGNATRSRANSAARPEATEAMASSSSGASIGFVRWRAKPARFTRARSSQLADAVNAMTGTVALRSRRARRSS
jgi:RNA polymerase sigma-70 factor (ECF subfamily)